MTKSSGKRVQNARQLDVTPDPQVLELFSALEIPPAGCLSELIDNSVDSFRLSATRGGEIEIEITQDRLRFTDNGPGMTLDALEQSLKAGSSTKKKVGELGLFGIGFNLATMKLGVQTTVYTKTASDTLWNKVVIDVRRMVKENSFKISSELEEIDYPHVSGTIVELKLRRDFVGRLGRKKALDDLRVSLGRRYSFILRKDVPGLSGEVANDKHDFRIMLNGNYVKPFIPCIWDQARKMANTHPAIQLIDQQLVDTQVCQSCRTEMSIDHSGPCESCGGNELIEQVRRIWGWLGVQRCLETEEYGVDLIRNGRTIEIGCKDFFKFRDPDTGSVELEYPIEQTNRGRIVGEIHCDHVPVEFTKQSFERTQSFRKVEEVVRGSTWLRPQYAVQHSGEKNESPMAIMFSGVRRIDPGRKCLTPGNGKKAILVEAKNWVKKFHEGDPAYASDEKWWEACVSHENLSSGSLSPPSPDDPAPVTTPTGPDPTAPILDVPKPIQPKQKTLKELSEQWQAGANKRHDLSKPIYLSAVEHKFEMDVFETISSLRSPSGGGDRAAFLLPTTGSNFEVYVHKHHPLIEKWGRSTTDVALGEAASYLARQGSKSTFSEVLAELIENFPDEEDSEITIRSRCTELKSSVRRVLPKQLASDSELAWGKISEMEQAKILQQAEELSATDLSAIGKDGEFARFITWRALIELIDHHPELLFNGRVFTQALAGNIPTLARERVLSNTVSAIKDLIVFEDSGEGISLLERRKAVISIDFLYEKLCH